MRDAGRGMRDGKSEMRGAAHRLEMPAALAPASCDANTVPNGLVHRIPHPASRHLPLSCQARAVRGGNVTSRRNVRGAVHFWPSPSEDSSTASNVSPDNPY